MTTSSDIPHIPESALARQQLLLNIASRVVGENGRAGAWSTKIQSHYRKWLDALLDAGVDVNARGEDGRDCMDILCGNLDGKSKMTCSSAVDMARTVVDRGYRFVERLVNENESATPAAVIARVLAHMSSDPGWQGRIATDEHGNTVLHAVCMRGVGKAMEVCIRAGLLIPSRHMCSLSGHNKARLDGATPLHLAWGGEIAKQDSRELWLLTHLLCNNEFGSSLRDRDQAGRSVAAIIAKRVRAGDVDEADTGAYPQLLPIQAAVMAQVLGEDCTAIGEAPSAGPRL